MTAYCKGNTDAFRELHRRYADRLGRSIGRQIRNQHDVQEIVQQTFLQLHRARHDFRQGSPLRPWIYTIANNLKREYFRRRARKPEAPLDLDGRHEPSVEPVDHTRTESAAQIHAAVLGLPDNQREVIELHWFEDMPFSEVAQVVGASVTAVKVRAHRGYGKLRTKLKNLGNLELPSGVRKETESP